MRKGKLLSLSLIEFIFAVLAAWMVYAFLRVHSMGALGFALVVMAAMAFLIVRYRKQAAKEEQEYASNGMYEGDEDAGDDETCGEMSRG